MNAKSNGSERQGSARSNKSSETSDIGSTKNPVDHCASGPLTCHKITPGAANPIERDQLISSHDLQGPSYVNGVTGSLGRHAKLAESHLAAEFTPMPLSYILFNVSSNGLIRDVAKIGLTQLGYRTAIVTQLANILLDVQRAGHHLDIVCHSGGCAELKAGIRYAFGTTGEALTNIRANFHAGANNMSLTNRVLDRAGVARFGGYNAPGYRFDPKDLVPQLIGGNALFHPIDMLMSIWNAPRLLSGDENLSPHTLPYKPNERLR